MTNQAAIIREKEAVKPLWTDEQIQQRFLSVSEYHDRRVRESLTVGLFWQMRDEYEQELNTVRRNWYQAVDENQKLKDRNVELVVELLKYVP